MSINTHLNTQKNEQKKKAFDLPESVRRVEVFAVNKFYVHGHISCKAIEGLSDHEIDTLIGVHNKVKEIGKDTSVTLGSWF